MIELKEYTDKLIIAQIQIHAGLSMVDFKGAKIAPRLVGFIHNVLAVFFQFII
jgi:hypothetical protein